MVDAWRMVVPKSSPAPTISPTPMAQVEPGWDSLLAAGLWTSAGPCAGAERPTMMQAPNGGDITDQVP